jgi:uncharacterized protein (TIGR03437 family)
LTYVSPTRISFQIPWELTGETAAIVQVQVGEVMGPGQSVALGDYNPSIFTLNQTGAGPGYITLANADTPAQPVGSYPGAQPVQPGQVIAIFCSGLGPVSNEPASGVASPGAPFASISSPPSVTVAGEPAQITFDALAPGLVGVYVVNVTVPSDVQDSDVVPVVVSIGGINSNTVTFAVQSASSAQ